MQPALPTIKIPSFHLGYFMAGLCCGSGRVRTTWCWADRWFTTTECSLHGTQLFSVSHWAQNTKHGLKIQHGDAQLIERAAVLEGLKCVSWDIRKVHRIIAFAGSFSHGNCSSLPSNLRLSKMTRWLLPGLWLILVWSLPGWSFPQRPQSQHKNNLWEKKCCPRERKSVPRDSHFPRELLLLFFRSEYLQDKNHGPFPFGFFFSHLLCCDSL